MTDTRTSELPPPIPRDLDLTLLIPCYLGEDWIEACLRSVMDQTLARDRFEVLIVLNGPIDQARERATALLATQPELQHRIIEADRASLSHARNLAIRLARGRWLTWLDIDDTLSANYLEELLASSASGVVPVAQVIDVSQEDGQHSVSIITEHILSFAAGVHPPHQLWRPMSFAACKLLETDRVVDHLFDVDLKSGEDVAYFAPLMDQQDLTFDNTPAHRGATYYRLVRAGSMSRQALGFDFSVSQRLAVIGHLERAVKASQNPDMQRVMRSMMRSQATFTGRFLRQHPEELSRIRQAVTESGVDRYPWDVVNAKSNRLAISYNFLPFNDASAMVAAKRLLADGHQWNVVSNNMEGAREKDPNVYLRALSAVSIHETVPNPPFFGAWGGIESFCHDGMSAIQRIEDKNGAQKEMYSRSMWPASHFLAALKKLDAGDGIHWTAEFSDPQRRDIRGNERAGRILNTALSRRFRRALMERGAIPEVDSIFSWAEYLPYVLADRLLFTNPHQLTYMMGYLSDSSLRDMVRRKAVISPQPAPPAEWYHVVDAKIPWPRQVNLAYFGTFYANRGMGNMIDALTSLPPEMRKKLRLDIYGVPDKETRDACNALSAEGVVRTHKPKPFLGFLNLATHYDCLVVNDADSSEFGHMLNPYLPSKLADYRGANVPIWGIYEPGSMLSRSDLEYRTRLGDKGGMLSVLKSLMERGSRA